MTVIDFQPGLIFAGKARVSQGALLEKPALALPANIRLGLDRMIAANTLAYYDMEWITTVKSFIVRHHLLETAMIAWDYEWFKNSYNSFRLQMTKK